MLPLPRRFLFKHCFIPLDLSVEPPPELLDSLNFLSELPE
jgi:hypothetical protein